MTHGHPKGLVVLSVTEVWERLSFYGMRALLVLFLIANFGQGGLGLSDSEAAAIYGLFMAGASIFGMPGGWLGDVLLGHRNAVITGGILILLGNIQLAVGAQLQLSYLVFSALGTMVVGVGFLKPNISVLVHALYVDDPVRRDSGFALYFMGINIGSLIGALAIPVVSLIFGWPVGFALAGVGMGVGLSYFFGMRRHLLDAPGVNSIIPRKSTVWMGVFVLGTPVAAFLVTKSMEGIAATSLSGILSIFILLVTIIFVVYLLFFNGLTTRERLKLMAILPLLFGVAIFLTGVDQAGASFSFFADRFMDRELFGVASIPSGSFQSMYVVAIIIMAPLLAFLWTRMATRGFSLSATHKFAIGLLFLGLGFLVMSFATMSGADQSLVAPWWLIGTYFLHGFAELHIGPVGLSAVTKAAPSGFAGRLLGVWFLFLALGHNASGLVASQLDMKSLEGMQQGFIFLMAMSLVSSALLFSSNRYVKRWVD